jgi:hypothetical protein
MRAPLQREAASFRDPSGFVFWRKGVIYRQINEPYREDWEAVKKSGLLIELERDGLWIPAPEASLALALDEGAIAVLKPLEIPFTSYPYEWSFGMLKDAALLTLDIQKKALTKGLTLKDASAYNVQFLKGAPIFIDSLSLEMKREGEPWAAYGQFCRHFLGPLALMAHCDLRLGTLLGHWIDGVPLDLASRLLPKKTWFKPGLLTHIHLHGRAAKSEPDADRKAGSVTLREGYALVESLIQTVESLSSPSGGTEWSDYYRDSSYSPAAMASKTDTLTQWLAREPQGVLWDIGANSGRWSSLAESLGWSCVAIDSDPGVVEMAYRSTEGKAVHPLCIDLLNPSPGRGWDGRERSSLLERGPADMALALALIHHLVITGGIPLPMVMETLCRFGRRVVLEWVPKEDSQVQRMLSGRKDIFSDFNEAGLVAAIPLTHRVVERAEIEDSGRSLWLLEMRGES